MAWKFEYEMFFVDEQGQPIEWSLKMTLDESREPALLWQMADYFATTHAVIASRIMKRLVVNDIEVPTTSQCSAEAVPQEKASASATFGVEAAASE